MTEHKKISIIIPVYNTEPYLEQCLNSVLRQTLQDIEIICVDDGSADRSRDILERYKDRYDNIRCVYHDQTRSALQARKDGVLISSGDFIMFLDSDDYYELNACETAYNAIRRNNTDILQFDTVMENCANLPDARIKANQNLLKPYTGGTIRGNLLKECFLNKKFNFTLANKMFYGDLCRKAFAETADGYFPKANDLYPMFYILKEAKSYSGIPDKLYHYCFGRGMTGHNQLTLHDFELCCASAKVYKEIKTHEEQIRQRGTALTANGHSSNDPAASIYAEEDAVIENIRQRFHSEQLGKWEKNVPAYDKKEALAIYCKAWDHDAIEIVGSLSRMFPDKRPVIAEYMDTLIEKRQERHKIKTIALYYRNIYNGGAQRVVARLANMFADAEGGSRYNVILLTDHEPNADDYFVSPRIRRVVLPMYEPGKKNYEERGKKLLHIIEKYDIDVFFNSMWLGDSILWDLLCLKMSKKCPAVFVHLHSFFAWPFRSRQNKMAEIFQAFQYADGLITLSDADREFWKYCNKNTYKIMNPCSETAVIPKKEWHGSPGSILWVGRISDEKQPLDIIPIMKYVVEKRPDAVCHAVGDGENKKLIKALNDSIAEAGLQNNIILEGFREDVDPFYKNADVLISTSSVEGFPLVIMEAASHGLPTVLYDLPWLDYFKIIRGWEKVPQNDVKGAAEKILMLLSNQQAWEERSRLLFESYGEYREYDIQAEWQRVLDNYENGTLPDDPLDERQALIYQQMMAAHYQIIEKLNGEIGSKNKEIRGKNEQIRVMDQKIRDLETKLKNTNEVYEKNRRRGKIISRMKKELAAVYKSETWKAGSIIVKPFSMLKKKFRETK